MSDQLSELGAQLAELSKQVELLRQWVMPEGGNAVAGYAPPGVGLPPPPSPPAPSPPPGSGGLYCKACGTYNTF